MSLLAGPFYSIDIFPNNHAQVADVIAGRPQQDADLPHAAGRGRLPHRHPLELRQHERAAGVVRGAWRTAGKLKAVINYMDECERAAGVVRGAWRTAGKRVIDYMGCWP